jgi:hypothetical protein
MSAAEDPEGPEWIEEHRSGPKLVFDYLRPFFDGTRVRAKLDDAPRAMIEDVEPTGLRRLYGWPVKVVVLVGLLVALALSGPICLHSTWAFARLTAGRCSGCGGCPMTTVSG